MPWWCSGLACSPVDQPFEKVYQKQKGCDPGSNQPFLLKREKLECKREMVVKIPARALGPVAQADL